MLLSGEFTRFHSFYKGLLLPFFVAWEARRRPAIEEFPTPWRLREFSGRKRRAYYDYQDLLRATTRRNP